MSATTDGHEVTVEVEKSPAHAFDCITAITKWWVAPAGDFEGRSTALGDEFVKRWTSRAPRVIVAPCPSS